MAIYKQHGSNVWWYEFQFDGVRYRESSKSTSKTVAAEALRARRRHVEEAFNGIKKRQMPKTFAAGVQELLTAKKDKVAPGTLEILQRSASHLIPVFGKKLLIEITVADMNQYKRARAAVPGVSLRYVNMDLELMRAVLRRNGLWERIRPDFSFYRLDDEYGYELPECDEPKLLEACANSISRGLYTAVTLALCTGMRKSEVKHLRWNQIFLDQNPHLIVGVSKTVHGRRRRVPLNARAIETLTNWASQFTDRLPEHFVFPSEKYVREPDEKPGAVYNHDPAKPIGSWRAAWKSSKKRCGINMRFHDLRHTAVSRMLRAGVPLTTVAAIVGWSPSTMYIMAKRYAHILQPEMRKAVAVLEGASHEKTKRAYENERLASSPKGIDGMVPPKSRYNRENLYEKVWQVPLRALAREYGVSDVAIAKACRRLHVPLPGRGYWAKKAAGKSVETRPPLLEIPIQASGTEMRTAVAVLDGASVENTKNNGFDGKKDDGEEAA